MWSVATEWQIYFLFPILLSIWRRYGISATVGAGFLAGCLPSFVRAIDYRDMCPWYAGLFAMGMAAAVAVHRERPRSRSLGDRSLWFFVAGILSLALFAPPVMRSDSLVGLGTACLIVSCARFVLDGNQESDRPRLLRLFESPWVVKMGGGSYSLHLIHFPLLSLASGMLRGWGWGADARMLTLLLAISPACIGAASLFSLVFEKPFLVNRQRSTDRPGRSGV